MIESCANCGQDFLTEADPHLVIPSSKGYVLKCFCVVYKLEAHIKELEKKLAVSSQIMDAMTKTSQNNYKLTQQVKDIEQQLNQSNKERAELEQRLAIAVEALEMISLDNIYVGENGWRDEYILGYNQAREALNKINQK
jgi:seryl-tRNA synthetase